LGRALAGPDVQIHAGGQLGTPLKTIRG